MENMQHKAGLNEGVQTNILLKILPKCWNDFIHTAKTHKYLQDQPWIQWNKMFPSLVIHILWHWALFFFFFFFITCDWSCRSRAPSPTTRQETRFPIWNWSNLDRGPAERHSDSDMIQYCRLWVWVWRWDCPVTGYCNVQEIAMSRTASFMSLLPHNENTPFLIIITSQSGGQPPPYRYDITVRRTASP